MPTLVNKSPHNKIRHFIDLSERRTGMKFIPSKPFYKKIEINQIRFWKIVRNEAQPDLIELYRLAEFFGVEPIELF